MLQKKIYKKNQEAIRDSVIPEDVTFRKYERDYLNAVRHYKKISSVEEMMEAVLKADIVYVGDYHTLNQSQRSFLRVLRALVKKTTHFALSLEVVQGRFQKNLDQYMSGRLSDQNFLKKTGFKEHWFFDLWENFRPLFDFARYYHIPVYGIEPPAEDQLSLTRRDAESARLVAELFEKDPSRKIFVFVGDLHLARNHLPWEVQRELKKKGLNAKSATLFQNSDSIYWKLAEKEMEDQVGVVKISENEFCRMHTPPIIAQQSFLNWLEHEEGILDYADAKETFLGYVDQIAAFLGIELGSEKEEVEVFTCGDLSFLKRLRESKKFSDFELKEIKKQILRSESYYIPKLKFVYLANVSVNHAAEEAAHLIRHLCAGEEFPRPMQEAFYANIIHEALAFFGSKIINHRRKCARPQDFKKNLAYLEKTKTVRLRGLEYLTDVLFLEHEERTARGEAFHSNKIAHFSTDLFLSVTHAIAYDLGERLFYGLLDGHVAKDYVRELHYDSMAEEGEPVWWYFDLVRRLKGVKLPKRI